MGVRMATNSRERRLLELWRERARLRKLVAVVDGHQAFRSVPEGEAALPPSEIERPDARGKPKDHA